MVICRAFHSHNITRWKLLFYLIPFPLLGFFFAFKQPPQFSTQTPIFSRIPSPQGSSCNFLDFICGCYFNVTVMIVAGCRLNLRDRRDEETCEIPRLKSPILRRIYEPLKSQRVVVRKLSAPDAAPDPISTNNTTKKPPKIPRRSRRISRSLKLPRNQLPRELLQIPSLPFPRWI